jgi:KDO2-lipid IV(A) lauroyltransferase
MTPRSRSTPLRAAARSRLASRDGSHRLRPRGGRALRNRLLARVIELVGLVLGTFPVRLAISLGGLLGSGAYRILGRDRRRSLEHLGMAFPGIAPAARARLAREAFRNAGRSFAELAQWRRIRNRLGELVTIEGLEHLERGLALGRGLVAVTGHIGNWELLAATFAQRGYPLNVVVRRVNDDRFEQLVADFRNRARVRTIRRDDTTALRSVIRILRSGGILALLVDQDTRGPGVFVPFFGRPAHTSPGAAIIALRSRAPVVAAFIERRAAGHHVRIEPLFGFQPAPGRRPGVEELTARITAAIEEQIRRRPSEWVWWHRRWRRQPAPGTRLERSA